MEKSGNGIENRAIFNVPVGTVIEMLMTLIWIQIGLKVPTGSVVDPKLFFSDPDPIFRRVLDPDPDPTWLVKSFESSFGSDP
jgi:hypothetical protein